LLVVIALPLGFLAWTEHEPRSRAIVRSSFLAVSAPAILIPLLWAFGDPLRDPARFAAWAAVHQGDLTAARRKDGVFKYWDGWGIAGAENDSYLASDPTDTLARRGVVDDWAKAHDLGCDVVSVRRMARGVYLLTTFECVIAGFPG
jgi:hypothetical protein